MNLPSLNDGFFVDPPDAPKPVPIFSLKLLGVRIRALAECGLTSEAQALAQGLICVLSYPARPQPDMFSGVDFAALPPGPMTIEATGDFQWGNS